MAGLLQDLLHVIHSRYQGKLYAYGEATRITQFEVDGSNDDVGVPLRVRLFSLEQKQRGL